MAQQPQIDASDSNFTVIINEKQDSFDEATLKQFQYFQTYFSKRWQSVNDKNEEKSSAIDVGNHVFSLEHLDHLINISKTKKIPSNLTCDNFCKLIECDLYFGSDVLTIDTLINFLELREYYTTLARLF